MRYSEVLVDLPLERATETVTDAVDGIRTTRDGGSVVVKTNTGITVATLSRVRADGADRTRLRYRTTMLSPSMANARSTARRIRNALVEHADTS